MSSGCLSAAFWLCSWSRNLLHNLRKDEPVNPISGLHTSGSLGFEGAGSQCNQERENVKGTANQYIPGPSPKIQIRASSPAALSLSALAKSELYFRLQLAHPSCDSFFNCLPFAQNLVQRLPASLTKKRRMFAGGPSNSLGFFGLRT